MYEEVFMYVINIPEKKNIFRVSTTTLILVKNR